MNSIPAPYLIHQDILRRFSGLKKRGRLAHAYLFVGPQGIGKFETALAVAKLVNCENQEDGKNYFCDTCSSCLRIERGGHPDLHLFRSSRDEPIKIEDIRDLITGIQLKSFEAKKKVFIIERTENLTLQAGNALLKTLEEPSMDSLLILTTVVAETNLSTIRSRCHTIYFPAQSKEKLADFLINDYHVEDASARCLASLSGGSWGKAKGFYEDRFLERKNEIIKNVIFTADSENYLKKILADKDQTKELLDVILSWFRDVLLIKLGVGDEHLIHADCVDDLRKSERFYTHEDVEGIIAELVKTNKLLNDNLNVKIALAILKEKIWVR